MKRIFCTGISLLLFAVAGAQTDEEGFGGKLAAAALLLTRQEVIYDPAYYVIDYPNGDIPPDRGVCTDVIIRAYRAMGIDLQREVHEDMCDHFDLYPAIWGLERPDTNIDHRRVRNLMTYFERYGEEKAVTLSPEDYKAGDIVCWNLGGALTHIGIVADRRSGEGSRPMIIHNIGRGQVLEDCLFDFSIIGHYIYQGK